MSLLSPVAATQTAQVRLYCGSLQFERAYQLAGGYGASLDITTTFPELNKELQPNLGSDYAYSALLQLVGIDSVNPFLLGALALNPPAFADANNNKYPDFFEVSMPVEQTNTTGSFVLPMGAGTVDATWTRTAGSATGSCRLVFTFDLGYETLTFTHQFTLLEYTGTLAYTPGSNAVFGMVALSQTGHPTNTLQGPMSFTKPLTNMFGGPGDLYLDAGHWTNAAGQAFVHPNTQMNHSTNWPTNYSALLEPEDGLLETPTPDYRLWVLSIDDTHDQDADGIPDLADTSPVPPLPPSLAIALAETNVWLGVYGELGRTYSIQESETLLPDGWNTVATITLTNNPHLICCPPATNGARFWRASSP